MAVRCLLSWSRKELGDSEPFGLLLMLERESDLISLHAETNVCLLITAQLTFVWHQLKKNKKKEVDHDDLQTNSVT